MAFGPRGFKMLSMYRALFDMPLVAIGGLKKKHIPEVKRAGANSVAMISAITESPAPLKELYDWKFHFLKEGVLTCDGAS